MKKSYFNPCMSELCVKCKGQCWRGVDNNLETQKAVREMFDGELSCYCVIGSRGEVHCPYAK